MKILFLDDSPERHNKFFKDFPKEDITGVFTAQEAIDALTHTKFNLVCLDHDLGEFNRNGQELTLEEALEQKDRDGSGMDVANFIAHHMDPMLWPDSVLIHSHNPDGAKAMKKVLEVMQIKVRCVAF